MSTEPMTQAIAVLRTRVGASYGQAGRDWCNELPVLIADLVSRWGLTLTGEPARAGYGGIAVPVIRVDHGQAILKVTFSLDVRDLENEVLCAWGGRHAAQLLERDDRRHARLLERLGPLSLSDSGDPVTAMSIAGQLAAHLAVRPPPTCGAWPTSHRRLPARSTTPHQGTSARSPPEMSERLRPPIVSWDQINPRPFSMGDLQGSNILQSPTNGWAVIDPLGMVGEIALEALTVLRDRWTALPVSASPRAALLRQPSRVIAWTHARSVRAVLAGVKDDNGMHAWVASQLDSVH